jgi:lipoprotein-anchoring transpeptidase ErfK/SrfK
VNGAARTVPLHHRSSAPSRSAVTDAPATPAVKVHASLREGDGQTYGVGMPIIMQFDKKVTDASALRRTVVVRVNGHPVDGAWYFEDAQQGGYSIEAHYRTRDYWPAHSRIELDAPLKGVSAGRGRVFDNDLTLSISIGPRHISTVDASDTHPLMTVTSDGRVVRRLAVSLGTATHETYRGSKIVEEFDRVQDMEGTPVPWSVRVTNSGEFVHAAPWNSGIGRANLSHGCTNLSTSDAEWFYHFSLLGDVVEYPNAPGRTMAVWDGLGDWNLPWAQWRDGGLL